MVYKFDRITGAPLAGAIFVLRSCATGVTGGHLTTGSNGIGTVAVAEPGCYDVTEQTPPAGYLADTTTHRVNVPDGWFTELTVYNTPVGYVGHRNPERRVPIQSIPSGRIY